MENTKLHEEDPSKTIGRQTIEQQGEEWIQAILDKNFEHLAAICHVDINSTLLLPKRIVRLENAADLGKEVEDWFGEYSVIVKEQARVATVGEKLAVFYRLRCTEIGVTKTIEQQLFCTVRDGRIKQLWLICSGFQPDPIPFVAPLTGIVDVSPKNVQPSILARPQADALLEFKANEEQGSTCAMLTPYIKSKLNGLSTGQVLEAHVDDITARGDIEAWCRLSGNLLLKMDQTVDQELVFFIQKK